MTTNQAAGSGSWTTREMVGAVRKRHASCRTTHGGCFDFRSSIAMDFGFLQVDEFRWTSLVAEHVKCGEDRQALSLYYEMRQSGVQPSSYTFVAALKACSNLQDLESAKQIHAELIKSRCELKAHVGTMLVDVYSKCGSLMDARRVFEEMPERSVVAWNAMILGHAQMQEGEKALQLYALMRKEGVTPNNRTFVAALKACKSLLLFGISNDAKRVVSKELCLMRVRDIQSQIKETRSDIFVETMLVDVYSKCGKLVDARLIFENMPRRNVVSWTAMILGYAQMNKGSEALQLYARMLGEGVAPNSQTFVAALKACGSVAAMIENKTANWIPLRTQCLKQVRSIHAQVPVMNMFVGNMLIDVYSKCGSLIDAKRVFENMPARDVVSWNSIIMGCTEMGASETALQLYEQMQRESLLPDERTLVAVLKACRVIFEVGGRNEAVNELERVKCLDVVRTIYLWAEAKRFRCHVNVCNMLMNVFATLGRLSDARCMFDMMPRRDVVSWNTMILGYAQRNVGEEGLQLYRQMQQVGMPPDDRTFVSVLKVCSSLASSEVGRRIKDQSLKQVRAIHLDAERSGASTSIFVGNLLVDVYSECGSLIDARIVFDKMPHRDVVSWNAIILGCARMEEREQALQLYAQMQQDRVEPDAQTFVGLLKACSLVSWEDYKNGGCESTCLKQVRVIHSDIVKAGCESAEVIGTALLDAYVKCGSLEDARYVFEKMPVRDVPCWNAMMLGYTEMDKGDEALQLYARMQSIGVAPDSQTFVAALKACGVVAGLEKGKQIHAQVRSYGLSDTNLYVITALIDMYSKCGSMLDAQLVFNESLTRDTVTWTAIIAGYARHGETGAVFDLFQKMEEEKVHPNCVTFQIVLSVCSHAGLVKRGQVYFEAMRRDYCITPTIEHYTCMIDLLGRAGHVDKAIALAKTMPFQPDSVVWETVLSSCRKWNNVQVGEEAFECAIKLNGKDVAAYTLMCNIYAGANMGEAVKEIEAKRMKARAWMQSGQSWWTDEDGIVHTFMAGSHVCTESQDMFAHLQGIGAKLRGE